MKRASGTFWLSGDTLQPNCLDLNPSIISSCLCDVRQVTIPFWVSASSCVIWAKNDIIDRITLVPITKYTFNIKCHY